MGERDPLLKSDVKKSLKKKAKSSRVLRSSVKKRSAKDESSSDEKIPKKRKVKRVKKVKKVKKDKKTDDEKEPLLSSAEKKKLHGKLYNEWHTYLEKNYLINMISDKTGKSKVHIAQIIGAFVAFVFIFGYGMETILYFFTTLFPIYSSFKALLIRKEGEGEYHDSDRDDEKEGERSSQTPPDQKLRNWLIYWMILALYGSIEWAFEPVIAYIPFYTRVKLLMIIWLYKGAGTIYKLIVEPQLLNYKETIDKWIFESLQSQKEIGKLIKSSVKHIGSAMIASVFRRKLD